MMHFEAGVRVVVAGGRPTTGPMQAPSGSRGARVYSTTTLDNNIAYAQEILQADNNPQSNFLPNRTEALTLYVTYASINLRDQVRRNETTPLQFAYEAADCRIFYTPQTVYNMTALWQYAADAIWTTPSKCVQGSTGFATTGTNVTDFLGPSASQNPDAGVAVNLTAHLDTSSIPYLLYLDDSVLDVTGLRPRNSQKAVSKTCSVAEDCNPGSVCQAVTVCKGSGKVGPMNQCVPTCRGDLTPCGQGQRCQPQSATGKTVGNQRLLQGFCPPAPNLQKCGLKVTGGLVHVGPAPPDKRDESEAIQFNY